MSNPDMFAEQPINVEAFLGEFHTKLEQMRELVSAPHFEFGDNPQFTQEILLALQKIQQSFDKIASQYDISKQRLGFLNPWYKASRKITEATSFVEKIQQKHFGSKEQTEELLKHLEKIEEAISNAFATLTKPQ